MREEGRRPKIQLPWQIIAVHAPLRIKIAFVGAECANILQRASLVN